jgi:hypothetical protein
VLSANWGRIPVILALNFPAVAEPDSGNVRKLQQLAKDRKPAGWQSR